jgi:hypothetical protein
MFELDCFSKESTEFRLHGKLALMCASPTAKIYPSSESDSAYGLIREVASVALDSGLLGFALG